MAPLRLQMSLQYCSPFFALYPLVVEKRRLVNVATAREHSRVWRTHTAVCFDSLQHVPQPLGALGKKSNCRSLRESLLVKDVYIAERETVTRGISAHPQYALEIFWFADDATRTGVNARPNVNTTRQINVRLRTAASVPRASLLHGEGYDAKLNAILKPFLC